MDPKEAVFVVTRSDQLAAPVMLVQQGILLGRLPSCQIVLNHPTVSRVHAGINRVENEFYLINLSRANSLIINGRLLAAETADILAAGDVVDIGPFTLVIEEASQRLAITITQLATVTTPSGGLGDSVHSRRLSRRISQRLQTGAMALAGKGTGRLSSLAINNVLKVFWKKRTRDRAERLSPLHPRERPLPGKARINWRPTGDLVRDWPFSIFVWSFLAVMLIGVAAAFAYAPSFAPAPLSEPHTRGAMTRPAGLAIARQPNGNSCTSCHRPVAKMEAACTDCHLAPAFAADITDKHRAAGISCTACHGEHRGGAFQPKETAFATCASCHNDANKQTYMGQRVSTPHGGTIGYPVHNGVWDWPGLSDEELSVLPEVLAQKNVQDDLMNWRSKQFHALHVYRIKVPPGMAGNSAGQVSCSTCHKSFVPMDRVTPATTCAGCHQQFENGTGGTSAARVPLNCTSCHVQHPLDTARWGQLLTDAAHGGRTDAILASIKARRSQ